MDLRDLLAMNYALEAIQSARDAGRECHVDQLALALQAYSWADAMLKAKAKGAQ